jgi:exosortase A-associated hydrolase 1
MAHIPQPSKQCGVLIVVGGPQYRVGSHRQFLLLARELASNGFPVLRFDYTGMGDSEGEQKTFENIDADLRAAIDGFYQQHSDLKNIVIWGLCDAASAALFYAYQDQRVKGLILLNPWVYTTQGAAKTYLKHYYLQRLLSRELWSKIFSGKFDAVASIASLVSMIKKMLSVSPSENIDKEHTNAIQAISPDLPLPERMKQGLERFKYPVLCILSGNDLTASEFKELIVADLGWQQLFNQQRVQRLNFDESDHTFSRAVWRNQVSKWTLDWLQNLG